jgi:hypothetical protein
LSGKGLIIQSLAYLPELEGMPGIRGLNFLEKISDSFRKKEVYFYLILGLIILYAFLVRFLGIKFGLPYLHAWDEPSSASAALRILKTGDFNPHWFHYPSFTIYSSLIVDIFHYYYLMGQDVLAFDYLRSLDEILISETTDKIYINEVRGWKEIDWIWTISHPSFYLWNRAFFAVLGTASVGLTYLISKENYGKAEGMLAALFLAGFSFHILQSSIIRPDIPVSFFILLVCDFIILIKLETWSFH